MSGNRKQRECGMSGRGAGALTKGGSQKNLKIVWQQLISDGRTCPRCGSTEEELDKAVYILRQSLAPLGIDVVLEKKELSISDFQKDPLQSNRIWINNLPLEDYIKGSVGQSACCDACGPSECRTLEIEGQVYETIPSEMIIRAGLAAASQLINAKRERPAAGMNGDKR